jgi:hypothetical protein
LALWGTGLVAALALGIILYAWYDSADSGTQTNIIAIVVFVVGLFIVAELKARFQDRYGNTSEDIKENLGKDKESLSEEISWHMRRSESEIISLWQELKRVLPDFIKLALVVTVLASLPFLVLLIIQLTN